MLRRLVAMMLDTTALTGFVVLGLREHVETPGAVLILRNAVPILAAWLPSALATGAYRDLEVRSMLATWGVAMPTAIVARSLWIGSPSRWRFGVFLLVALGFTLMFLLAGRLVARVIGPARSSSA